MEYPPRANKINQFDKFPSTPMLLNFAIGPRCQTLSNGFDIWSKNALISVLSSRTLQLNFMNNIDELQNSGISWTETILKPIQDTNLVKKIKKVKKRSLSSRS